MQSIADTIKDMQSERSTRGANSELAATVDEIVKVIPLTKRYPYGFWLKLVKRSHVSYTEMFGILKEINSMGNDKTGKPYNKAGTLVNKLKKLCSNIIVSKSSAPKKMKQQPTLPFGKRTMLRE